MAVLLDIGRRRCAFGRRDTCHTTCRCSRAVATPATASAKEVSSRTREYLAGGGNTGERHCVRGEKWKREAYVYGQLLYFLASVSFLRWGRWGGGRRCDAGKWCSMYAAPAISADRQPRGETGPAAVSGFVLGRAIHEDCLRSLSCGGIDRSSARDGKKGRPPGAKERAQKT